jgi:hypothetical protein
MGASKPGTGTRQPYVILLLYDSLVCGVSADAVLDLWSSGLITSIVQLDPKRRAGELDQVSCQHEYLKEDQENVMIGFYDVVRVTSQQGVRSWTWILIGTVALSACSTTKPPTDTLAKAELAVRSARDAKADELAPINLNIAGEKLEKAKQAMAAKRYDDARRLAESAQVDAELAEAKSEAEIVRRAADDVQRRADALQSEAERESRKPLTTVPNQE